MVLNSLGYVPVLDFGAPRILSGRAREVISGGQLVYISGAGGAVGSGANSFDPTADVQFAAGASGLDFTGVATHNAGSNEPVSVAIDGVVISTCDTNTASGRTVVSLGVDSVGEGTTAGHVIGRALTAGTSGTSNHILWHVKG